jgi:aromatic-L-amino-acid/L-tryptophan decarboxylase
MGVVVGTEAVEAAREAGAGHGLLEPPQQAREELFALVGTALEQHTGRLASLPVAPTVEPAEIRTHLASYDFATGRDAAQVVGDVVGVLTRWTVHTTSPRYFGLYNPTPTFYGVLADTLVAGFNPQLAAWSHAPAAVEIEAHVLRYLGTRLGLPAEQVAGSFTSGGAEANQTGLLLALTRTFPQVANQGVRALSGQPVFYASAESHLAWLKIAHVTGLGREAVRLVPVGPDLRLDVDALTGMIKEDRGAGRLPFLVVATAGTTSAGVIDPLPQIADLCAAEGLRLHVDAAWAGAVALSERLRPVLAGIDLADSVTLDAHKWLSVPMGAGMFLCTDAAGLGETFRVSTSYMPASTDEAVDPYVSSLQWSRRFIGLKLFLTLAVLGREGYTRQLEHDTALGEHLRARLLDRGWNLENTTPLPVVCFTDPTLDSAGPDVVAAHHQALAEAVVASGQAWISLTRLRGRPVLRACITSYRTTRDDVEALIDALDSARQATGHDRNAMSR